MATREAQEKRKKYKSSDFKVKIVQKKPSIYKQLAKNKDEKTQKNVQTKIKFSQEMSL